MNSMLMKCSGSSESSIARQSTGELDRQAGTKTKRKMKRKKAEEQTEKDYFCFVVIEHKVIFALTSSNTADTPVRLPLL